MPGRSGGGGPEECAAASVFEANCGRLPGMSDIAPVSGVPERFDIQPTPGDRPAYRGAEGPSGRAERPSDRVELSDRSRLLSRLASLPDVRQDVVDAARAKIEAGAYDRDRG